MNQRTSNKKWYETTMVGALILFMAMFLAAPGLAQNASETEDAINSAIKIYVDGVPLAPAGDSSKTAEPLLYEGAVYLPLEVLSQAFGKPVEWDSATNSIYIGAPVEIAEITVSTAEELIAALGSNRRVLLEEGIYNLTTVNPGYISANVYFGDRPDGSELFLDGIHNLTIQGIGEEQSEIIVEPRYANVLNFLNCSNISIVNIKAGHTEEGVCSGGVLLFNNCTNIQIEDTDMYGCGTIGIMLERVRDVRVTGSTIYGCSNAIVSAEGSSNILLKDCVFRDNTTNGSMISVSHTSGLTFDSCSFLRNTTEMSMFYQSSSENIVVENTKFIDNNVPIFADRREVAVDTSSRFENNAFDITR